jgi:23S rRNA pseudouridine1911/1915/1917 synthase
MKYLGHPLFNDTTYGGDKILSGVNSQKYRQFIANCFSICPRQALHARTLSLTHPETSERMHFESAIPEDFSKLVDKWRTYGTTILSD